MSIKSKIRTLVMASVFILTWFIQSAATENQNPFIDLENIPEKEEIIQLFEQGYVKGIGKELFAPNNITTAAEGVQFIVNVLQLNLDNVRFIKEPKATDYFINADNNAWYANALIIASVNGMELNPNLNPKEAWSKEEFAYYLTRAIEVKLQLPLINIIPREINGESELSIQYSGAIQRSLVYGITQLDSEGNFRAKSSITRAETAILAYNALEYIKSKQDGNESNEDNLDNNIESIVTTELKVDETVNGYNLNFELYNTSSKDITLNFSSGKKYDYLVYDENNELIYQWSNGKFFTMALVDYLLPIDEKLIFNEVWDYKDNKGNIVEKGKYRIAFSTEFYYGEEKVVLEKEVIVNYK